LSFTVNVELYLPEVEYRLCGREAGPKFQEPSCVVRKRISPLTGKQSDTWFKLTLDLDTTGLFTRLTNEFSKYIQPYLAAINSKNDIYSVLVAGHQSHYPSAQIHAMFFAGYQEAALKLFSSEFARSKYNEHYRVTLRSLAVELGSPAAMWAS
jgi:hypothetical protein